jgi:hypothetical protein
MVSLGTIAVFRQISPDNDLHPIDKALTPHFELAGQLADRHLETGQTTIVQPIV